MRLVTSMPTDGPYTGPSGGRMEVEVKMMLQAFASRASSGNPLPGPVLYIYECPLCGPVYLTYGNKPADNDDRDSLVGAPHKPAPTAGASAVAVPEPDE